MKKEYKEAKAEENMANFLQISTAAATSYITRNRRRGGMWDVGCFLNEIKWKEWILIHTPLRFLG